MVAYATPTPNPNDDAEAERIAQSIWANTTTTPVPAPTYGPPAPGVTPAPAATGSPTAQSTGNPTLDDVIARKGAPPVNLANPDLSKEARRDWITGEPISSSVLRYKWADGDYVDVWSTGETKQQHTPILDKGPAAPKTVSAPKSNANIVTRDAQGNLIPEANPNYVPSPITTGTQKKIGLWNPETKQVEWKDNPNYSDADARKADLDAQLAEIRLAAEKRQISVDAAKAQAEAAVGEYNRWYQSQLLTQNNLERQSRERGQDISAAVSLGATSANAVMGALPYIAPKGAMANFDKSLASLGSRSSAPVQYGPTPSAPFPFNPATLATDIAKQAIGTLPAQTGGVGTTPPVDMTNNMNAASQAYQAALAQQIAEMAIGQGGTGYRAPWKAPVGAGG